MTHRRTFIAALAAAPLAARSQILAGGRSMRWVVPFPPGGQGDAIARAWGDAFAMATKQTVVIDNRGGANGLLGIQAIKSAPADGSVLGVLNVSVFTALPLMMANAPYDPAKDLTPISRIVTSTVLCCVTAERAQQRGWRTFRDLIAWAKRPGQQLTKGSAGNASPGHLLISTVAKRTGADILHVPYKGGAPALTDLLGGQIDMVFDFMAALLPHVASGRLIPLAVGTRERSPLLPDVRCAQSSDAGACRAPACVRPRSCANRQRTSDTRADCRRCAPLEGDGSGIWRQDRIAAARILSAVGACRDSACRARCRRPGVGSRGYFLGAAPARAAGRRARRVSRARPSWRSCRRCCTSTLPSFSNARFWSAP